MNHHPSYAQIQQIREKLRDINTQYWMHEDFLTWRWWLIFIAFTIIPCFIMWKIIDKNRNGEIIFYGLFIGMCAVFLGDIGTAELWWEYPHKLFPIMPPFFPPDFILVPIFLMIVYQITHSWRHFIIATLIISLLMAYGGEMLFIWLGYYRLNTWRLEYSVLFYVLVSVVGRWCVTKLMSASKNVASDSKELIEESR